MFRCTVDGSHLGTSFFKTKKGFCLIIIIIIIINVIVEKGNFKSVVHSLTEVLLSASL